ncbi:MAG: hypothetical protein PHP84_10455 [Mesotoga sp.]|nr:hypothetical protein [Mesotoga sp.]
MYRTACTVLFVISAFFCGLAVSNYIDPAGYPYPWPDNPSPALASYEFNSLSDLADYYPTGSWSVAGGILSITGSGERRAVLNGSTAWTNYVVKGSARITDGITQGDSAFKIYARVTGTAAAMNAYVFEIDSDFTNRFSLRRIVNGVESDPLITSVTSVGFDWSRWQEISAVANGNTFTMYINGIEVLRYTDNASPYLNGRVGLGARAYTRVEVDYLRVYGINSLSREWKYYTYSGDAVYDSTGNSDLSSGGSVSPAHVDIVSSPTLPSVMVYFDSGVLMFRIVLSGNPLQLTGQGVPYTSSTWVVLMDLNGDGYRDFTVELDGTDQGVSPDDIKVFYSNTFNQYLPDGDLIWKQDSAKHLTNPTNVDGEPGTPANWDWNSSPTVWDYKRSRVTEYIDPAIGRVYLLDFQVPLEALDATSRGGPKIMVDSVFQLAFTTSANTNDPVQKDLAYQGTYKMDRTKPLLFGDPINSSGQISQIPLTSKITVTGCGPSIIEALVQDASILVNGQVKSSVTSVKFYHYFDYNGNGLADDGFEWVFTGEAVSTAGFNPWIYQWNTSIMPQGNYIVKAIVMDYQGNMMDSYLQYTDGDLRQVALFLNTCSTINMSVSGRVFEDKDSDGGSFIGGVDLPKGNVRVRLYRESDGNTALSGGDSFVTQSMTGSDGVYSFAPLSPGRYYVVVNSKDVAPASLNSGYTLEVPWAEQTFRREFISGAYYDVQAFGGTSPEVSDNFATWSNAVSDSNFQHLSVVDLTGGAQTVTGIDHGFSFNVVVNVADTGNNGPKVNGNQGTMRQFAINSNAIAGANAARFVMMTPSNTSSGSDSWWTVTAISPLPDITDANTSLNGVVYNPQGAVVNSDQAVFGGGTAGVENVPVAPIQGKEIEINCNDLSHFVRTAAGATNFLLKNIAFFNGGGNLGDSFAPVILDGPGFLLEGIVTGARANGARPADELLNRRYGLIINSSGTLSNSYIAHNGSGLLLTGSDVTVTGVRVLDNGIGVAGSDGNGVSIAAPAGPVTISNSIIDSNGGTHAGVNHGNGIYTSGDTSTTLENLTVSGSTASGLSFNSSNLPSVKKSIVRGSASGPGIRVSSDSKFGDFSMNSYYSNKGLAIDLLRSLTAVIIEGVNPNDGVLNPDYGNDGVDHPVISLASKSGNTLSVSGYVGQNAGSPVFQGAVVEIYAATAGEGDSYGGLEYGEGATYLGELPVDAQGNFEGSLSAGSLEIVALTAITRYESFSDSLGSFAYSTSEFGPNKPIGAGLKITGYLFEDLNFNRFKDSGEPGINSVRIELWKLEGTEWTLQTYTLSDSGGFYSFNVSQGSFRVVEDALDLYNSSTGGSDPSGYISTTPNYIEVMVDTSNLEVNFGDFRGFTVTGYVFDDSGGGVPSQANNALKDPGEKGIAGARVTLTNGSQIYTRYTDQAGLYRFFVSGGPVYPLVIRETDMPAYTSTGDHDSDGSASLEERNRITINSGVDFGEYYNFADVKRLLLEGINTVSTLPGLVAYLDHTLIVSTAGNVSITAISARGFGLTVYETDRTGNVLGIWNDASLRLPGEYYIRVAVDVPSDAINGTLDNITIRAVQDWLNSTGEDIAETYDTVSVESGGLTITKATRNPALSGDWGFSSEGKPGDTIEYRITFTNNSLYPLTSIVITDPLAHTLTLLQNCYSLGGSGGNVLLSFDGIDHLLVAEPGGDSNIDGAYLSETTLSIDITRVVGTLRPGSSGSFIFRTTIRE